MDIIVGTAGHIDHGKTALVRAITGMDADRLPEEKLRGITIDIGFAELEIGRTHFGFVDVPGHERFVKNMLAGASGIDLVLLVIAADEGVMPQTREHFEICRLLGVERGVVVLTKRDLVDEETLDLARMDAAELVSGSFLETAPVVAVSSRTGDGVDDLKTVLAAAAALIPQRSRDRIAFLPIDRSFTVKGFGAVVTGTLASGEIVEGGEMDLLPVGRRVRVRGVETHGRKVKSARAGQRTAVNLGGIDHSEIERSMVLADPGVLRPTQIIAAEVEVLADAARPLRTRQRVRVHVGTAEALARVFVVNDSGEIAPGTRGLVQLRIETPVACTMGERFILRSYSPQATIAGGAVLLNEMLKLRRRDIPAAANLLTSLRDAKGDRAAIVRLMAEAAGEHGLTQEDLAARTGWRREVLGAAIEENMKAGRVVNAAGRLIGVDAFRGLRDRTLAAIEEFHRREPLAAGIAREALRESVFRFLPDELLAAVTGTLEGDGRVVAEREVVRSTAHRTELTAAETTAKNTIMSLLTAARFEPAKTDEVIAAAAVASKLPSADLRKLMQMLLRSGDVVKVTDDFHFAAGAIEDLKTAVRSYAESSPDRVIDVPRFKEIAGVSRKYAIPLLEYLDRERITVRAGDKRVVLK